jgi:hypothetical protein
LVPRDAVHRWIQPERQAHGKHRPSEQINLTPRIVAAEAGVAQAEARFHVIERMPGATGFAEEAMIVLNFPANP